MSFILQFFLYNFFLLLFKDLSYRMDDFFFLPYQFSFGVLGMTASSQLGTSLQISDASRGHITIRQHRRAHKATPVHALPKIDNKQVSLSDLQSNRRIGLVMSFLHISKASFQSMKWYTYVIYPLFFSSGKVLFEWNFFPSLILGCG